FGIAVMDSNGSQERLVTTEPMQPKAWSRLFWRSAEDVFFARYPADPGTWRKESRWHSVNVRTATTTAFPMSDLEIRAPSQLDFAMAGRSDLVYLDGMYEKSDRHEFHVRSLADGSDR